ncbi:MAG TPA: glycosyltransferase family 2 protein [Candidatus Didemnitutus sp.]|nr:glycosyltransferase family 2 protein [Candidatus Didemnitutus sp.]
MKTISLAIPLYNESQAFPLLRERLTEFCGRLQERYRIEIVLVNDGSRDNTWDLIMDFARSDARVKGVGLSRNFGHQTALYCGYEFATGDAVISLDGDLQDPPEVALGMLDRFEDGADVVFAIRRDRAGESMMKRATAHGFYRLLGWLGDTRAPLDSGDFRLLSRRALDALLRMREKHKYLRGMVGWIGYRTAQVEYDRPARAAGVTKFSWMKMIRFASDGIISFSRFPLRLSFLLCLLAMVPFLGYLIYAFIAAVFLHRPLVPGWSSLLLCVIIFGSLNLFALGILGEYIGRMFENVKQRPDYFVMDVTSPDVIPVARPRS